MIDTFDIGIRLAVSGNHMRAIGDLVRLLGVADGSVQKLTRNLAGMKSALIGLGEIAGGMAIAKGLLAATKEADKLHEKLLAIAQLGGEYATPQGRVDTRAMVFDIHRNVPTSSALDAANLLQEIAPITHQGSAQPAAQGLLMTQAVLKQAGIAESNEDLLNLLRVIDLRGHMYNAAGKFDPAAFMTELNAAAAAIQMSGGQLHPNDMLQMVRQGGAAARAQTPEAFYGAGTEVAIGMGAGRAGTAETSMFAQLIGGIMPTRVAKEMQRMGLLHAGDWHTARGGGAGGGVILAPGVSQRFTGALHDPEAWIQDKLLPTLKAHGINSPDAEITEIFRLFGRQTTQRFVMDVLNNAPQVQRGRDMLNMAPDIQAKYRAIMGDSLTANLDAVSKSWTTFEQAFGEAGINPVIDGLHTITGALNAMSDMVTKHPEAAKGLYELTAGLSGLLVLGGSLRVVGFALGPIASGLGAIASISGLSAVGTALGGVASGLGALVAPIGAIMAVLKIGSAYETPETRKHLENLRKGMTVTPPSLLKPQDGFDVEGRPIHHESYIPSGGKPQLVQIANPQPVYVQMDGRIVAQLVSARQAQYLDMPSSGASRFDPKQSPSFPNDALRV